jgi:hypothetical protein
VVKHGRECHYFLCSISFDLVMRFASAPGRDRGVGLGLSGTPAGRSLPASRGGVMSSIDAATCLLLKISVNRLLGHIEHRRPRQVRVKEELRLDCPALQTLRGRAGSDFSRQRRIIIAGSVSKEYMAPSETTSHIHLLGWVDGWWHRESRKVGGPYAGARLFLKFCLSSSRALPTRE